MRIAFLLSLALAWPAYAQDAKLVLSGEGIKVVEVDRQITVKVKVTVVNVPFFVTAPPGALTYTWAYPAGVVAVDKDDSLFVTAAPRGELTFSVKIVNVDWDAKKVSRQFGSITFSVGDPGPGPTPPGPIGVPLGVPGFAVFIVYDAPLKETDPRFGIVYGQTVRKYLLAKCGTGQDGKTKNFAIYPFGVDASGAEQWKKDALQRNPGVKSWMIVSDGKSAYEGPIPATVDEAMKIFRQYAEPPARTLYNFPVQLPGEVVPFMPTKIESHETPFAQVP